MKNGKYTLRFFLGANTPQGFVSRFDQLADPDDGWRKYVIKGGPGTGKSGMMKRLAGELSHRCSKLELIYCSSDTNSLDAVIATDIKAAIADGTSPHGGSSLAQKFTQFFQKLRFPKAAPWVLAGQAKSLSYRSAFFLCFFLFCK